MKSARLSLLIRSDASPSIGTRHVIQSLALADAWKKHRGKVAFVVSELPQALNDRITSAGHQLFQIRETLGRSHDAINTLEIASVFQPDWIALFGQFDELYQKQLRQYPARILVAENAPKISPYADLCLNNQIESKTGPIPAVNLGPVESAKNAAPILRGPKYALLPRRPAAQKHIFGVARRILVVSGGEQSATWTLRTLQALSNLNRSRMVVDCVVDREFQSFTELAIFKRSANMHLRVHRNVDRLKYLAPNVDLAISATESDCLSIASYGVPSLGISFSEQIVAQLDPAGILAAASEFSLTSPRPFDLKIQKYLLRILNDREARSNMSQTGLQLNDGRGSTRVVRKMIGECISFRDLQGPVGSEDSNRLWRWRNDPETRSVSFHQQSIPLGSYQNQLNRQVNDPDCTIWIAENREGDAIGKVQLNLDGNGSAFISASLDPAFRGRGLGTILVQRATERVFQTLPIEKIVAQITPANVASERAFHRAGYTTTRPTTVNGMLANRLTCDRNSSDEKIIDGRLKRTA